MTGELRNLARSADGSVIHRADCRYARIPWHWADTATDNQLWEAKMMIGLRVCKACKPDWQRERDDS